MRRCLNLIFLIIILLLSATTVFGTESEDIVTTAPNGIVNWTQATIRATGIGVFSRKRADDYQAQQTAELTAKKAAANNLLQILSGIRIDSKTTVGDILKDKPPIKAEVRQMVSALEPIETVKNLSDNTFEVTLQLALRGKFSRLVLPAEIKQISSEPSKI